MLADRGPKRQSVGSLGQPGYRPHHSILSVIDFISRHLPRWSIDPERPPARAETELSSQLCVFLNDAARTTGFDFVRFEHQVPDDRRGGRSLDLAAFPGVHSIRVDGRNYSRYDLLLPVECKRLPTPSGARREEREYVSTRSRTQGGIQRFKLGLHGGNHEIAAIVGFVQAETLAHWHDTINAWISELDDTWRGEALLPADLEHPLHGDGASSCHLRSSHGRRAGISPTIELHHLWVLMRRETGP